VKYLEGWQRYEGRVDALQLAAGKGVRGALQQVRDREGEGDFLHRAHVPGHDEIALLARDFNAMLGRITDLTAQNMERERELATAAHAARSTFATYEEHRTGDMLEDEVLAPGVISAVYISGTAHAPRGAWPFGVPGVYGIDDAHVAAYARAAKTREGFQRYLDEWVLTPRKSFSPA